MDHKTVVETTINGEQMEFLCEPRQSLLEVLRDVLGMTGSKEGCLTGDCGACTVLIDGRAACSCLVLGVEAAGHKIETVEGLAAGLHAASVAAEVPRKCRACSAASARRVS